MEENKNIRRLDTNVYMEVVCGLLKEGREVPLVITGNSMVPFLVNERDQILIRKAEDPLKKGDMVFYLRENGQYVMHRIHHVTEDGYYLVGDAQTVIEGPIRREQIFGKIVSVCRKGKWIGPEDFWWKFFQNAWIRVVPLRKPLEKVYGLIAH